MIQNIVLRNIDEKFIRGISDSKFTLKNGKKYFEQGRVKSFEIRDDIIIATVKGNSLYKVEIDFCKDNLEDDDVVEDEYYDSDPIVECSCPYQGYGCKHVVAVLYKLLYEINSNRPDNKKNSYSPFDDLKFEDIIRNARIEKIMNALNILRNKKFDIESKTNERFFVRIDDGKKYNVCIWLALFGKNRTLNLIESCSCGTGTKLNPCEHLLAVKMLILRTVNPESIPKDYEKLVREKLEKEKYDSFVNKLVVRQFPQKKKKKYMLYFSIVKEGRGISFSVEKALVLKNGRIGNRSSVSVDFIRNKYDEFSEHEKRLFDLMFSFLDKGPYSYYYRSSDRVEKNKFETERDCKLLDYLRTVYNENPGRFVNVEIPREKAMVGFSFVENNKKIQEKIYLFKIIAELGDRVFPLGNERISIVGKDPLWLYVSPEIVTKDSMGKGTLVELECSNPYVVSRLLECDGIEISDLLFQKLIDEKYEELAMVGNVQIPKDYEVKETSDVVPQPRIFLRDYGEYFCIELRFLYGKKEAFYENNFDIIYRNKDGEIIKIKRNKGAEERFVKDVLMNAERKGNIFLPNVAPLVWLCEKSQELILKGFEIYGQDALLNFKISLEKPELRLEVSSGIDWFDINARVSFGKEEVSFEEIVNALCKQERFVKLSDGEMGIIPQRWLSKLSGVLGFLKKGGENSLRAAYTQIQIVEALANISNRVSVDKKYEEIRNKFKKFRGIKEMPLPKNLNGELREYQKAGYDWLHFLKEFSFGGCLADDMGLGKTVTALALLLYEKENSKDKKVSLIVVPTTLVFNWVREVQKFVPSLKVYVHHGIERLKNWEVIKREEADLIITTYGTLRNDVDLFKDKEFYYIVLDESQQIKNPFSKNTQSVYSLKGKYRLVLTGTPIENNYLELWSQFTFLNPGLLGSMEYFKEAFVGSVEREKEETRSGSLKNIINPFLLMRKKEQVAKELPDKQIITLYCDMSEEQRKTYESWKEKYKNEIKKSIDDVGFNRSRFKILEGLLRLRQICNHPLLVDESFSGESEKFDMLLKQIKEVISEGHKVLVFSSFAKMLHIFRNQFEEERIRFCYLDGQTKNRKKVVDEFQENENVKIFLISLKAGGIGLNLTAADYVFLVDPWWNPAAEMQAVDRAHRIGQDKKVFVYKAIVKNSIEEKILELQNSKLNMVKNVIVSEEGIFKRLTPDDINYFFETKEVRF